MDSITITLSVEELMIMPGDGIIRIIEKSNPPAGFLQACYEYENRPREGKGRWPVINFLRLRLANKTH